MAGACTGPAVGTSSDTGGSSGSGNSSGTGGSTSGSGGHSNSGTGGGNSAASGGNNGSGGGNGSGTGGSGTGGNGTGNNPGSGGSASGTGGTPCTALQPITRRLWRLSTAQYGNAVKDLLGLAAAPMLSNSGGQAAYAFFSDSSLSVDQNMQFAMFQTSEDVLTQIASRITQLAACNTGEAQMACATRFAQTYGQKAFRRPLDASEVTNLMAVYTAGITQDFNTAIGLMIQSLIISPSFVYRTELGPSTLTPDASGKFPDTMLTPYEVASQLGFMFLGSIPDAPLLAAAADGSLGTTAGLTTQINRLVGLQAVKTNLTSIMIDWFNVRQMFDKTKDTSLLSTLAAADQDQTTLENDLLTSTQQFVSDVLWSGSGKINDLFTSQKVFVNKRLATLYPGLTFSGSQPADNTTFVSAAWPSSQGRIGMLSQPSYLWSASDPALTSIVKRGKQIHDDILCQDALGMPVDLTLPSSLNVISCKSPDGTMSLSACNSEIQKSDARLMFQPCKACHSQMDPYARVLQNFGPIGNYRTVDEVGDPINTSVTFVPTSPFAPQTASGPTDFAQALVSSGVANGCSVQKIASYAIGSMIRTYNTCEVQDVRTQTDGTITSLFRQVALANFVRARAGGMK
jgi:hypothetical protein